MKTKSTPKAVAAPELKVFLDDSVEVEKIVKKILPLLSGHTYHQISAALSRCKGHIEVEAVISFALPKSRQG
jgi:hypothetical protein